MTTAHLVLTLYIGLIFLAAATRADAADPPKGTVIAAVIVQTWTCQTQMGVDRTPAVPSPWALKGHNARAVLNSWTLRRKRCLAALHERARQWNWQAWLPAHWYRVGVCETQLNWRHSNSSYQGAFGFAISSWDGYKLPGYPDEAWQASPWQQYQVALRIYNRFGMSGWGCKG